MYQEEENFPFLSAVADWKLGRRKGETDCLSFFLHICEVFFLRTGTKCTAVVPYLVSKLNVDWIIVLKCNGFERLLVWETE